MANKTTQVRKVVAQFGSVCAMRSNKRTDGGRSLKFAFWDTNIDMDVVAKAAKVELEKLDFETAVSTGYIKHAYGSAECLVVTY